MLHGCGSIRIQGLDIAVLRDRNVRMPQDALNCLVRYSEAVQIRRQPATEGMPAMPLEACLA
jgi:hypothetical protein